MIFIKVIKRFKKPVSLTHDKLMHQHKNEKRTRGEYISNAFHALNSKLFVITNAVLNGDLYAILLEKFIMFNMVLQG
jgi:hypothetical protein